MIHPRLVALYAAGEPPRASGRWRMAARDRWAADAPVWVAPASGKAEALALGLDRFRHPAIPSPGERLPCNNGTALWVRPWLEGVSLDAVTEPVELTMARLAWLASGLDALHAAGLAHGDIKPANAVATPDGRAVWIDFEFSQQAYAQADRIQGSIPTLPPEAIKREALDGRSDIYSFGILAHRMLTGRWPFAEDDPNTWLEAHQKGALQLDHALPAGWRKIIAEWTRHDPKDRPTGIVEGWPEPLPDALRLAHLEGLLGQPPPCLHASSDHDWLSREEAAAMARAVGALAPGDWLATVPNSLPPLRREALQQAMPDSFSTPPAALSPEAWLVLRLKGGAPSPDWMRRWAGQLEKSKAPADFTETAIIGVLQKHKGLALPTPRAWEDRLDRFLRDNPAALPDAEALPAAATALRRALDEDHSETAELAAWKRASRKLEAGPLTALLQSEAGRAGYDDLARAVAALPSKARSAPEIRLALADAARLGGQVEMTRAELGSLLRTPVAAEARLGLIELDWRGGDAAGALNKAQALLNDSSFPLRLRARLANLAGLCADTLDRTDEAQRLLEHGVETARQMRDEVMEAKALSNLARLHQRLGRHDEADTLYSAGLRLARGTGNRLSEAIFLTNLGALCDLRRDWEKAAAMHADAAYVHRKLANAEGEAGALANLGRIAVFFGQWEVAEQSSRQLMELSGSSHRALGAALALDSAFWRNDGPETAEWLMKAAASDLPDDARERAWLISRHISLSGAPVPSFPMPGCLSDFGKAVVAILEGSPPSEPLLSALADEPFWQMEMLALAIERGAPDDPAARSRLGRLLEAFDRTVPDPARRHWEAHPALLRWRRILAARSPRASLRTDQAGSGTGPLPSDEEEIMTLPMLRLLHRATEETDLSRMLQGALDGLIDLTGAERGFVLLERNGTLEAVAARNMDRETVRKAQAKYSRTITGRVMGSGQPFITQDAQSDDHLSERASVVDLRLKSVMCLPIPNQGRPLGVVYLDNRFRESAFSPERAPALTEFCRCLGALIERAAAEQQRRVRTESAEAERQRLLDEVGRLTARAQWEASSSQEVMERLNSQQRELEERYGYHSIVGVSAPLRKIYALIDRIKDIQTTVLVTGESGTGKECVARAIHFSGSRAGHPFVSLNCGAIPATLVESELFGYERGAFTGADRPHSGLFKQADGGTLFLDEIGLMGMDIQAKLLRVLQEGQIRPLGSSATIPVNSRIIAATNERIEEAVSEGRFREDLYYRLNVVPIEMPPLRERIEDIPLLIQHFIAEFNRANSRDMMPPMSLFHGWDQLPWPGNVRQLEHAVSYTLIMGEPPNWLGRQGQAMPRPSAGPSQTEHPLSRWLEDSAENDRFRSALLKFESDLLRESMERFPSRVKTAEWLGLTKQELHYRLKKNGLV